jgi:7-cyano-7-deazaguanine synthase
VVKTSVVLLSAGLDSAVALKRALDDGGVALALTFDYGQRAAAREVERARAMAERWSVPHRALALPWLAETGGGSALTRRDRALPRPARADLDRRGAAEATARAVWVPNRNGVFISVAAAFAEGLGAARVVAGFNAEEGATFPDNSEAFTEAATAALRLSTLSGVEVWAPTGRLRKVDIVRQGAEIGAPLDLVWSCYEGGALPCGTCESCARLRRAAEEAGLAERFAWS